MRILPLLYGLMCCSIISCSGKAQNHTAIIKSKPILRVDTLNLYDSIRNRPVPIAIYHAPFRKPKTLPELIILSHGYGANNPGSYLSYQSICRFLAQQGYMVLSIQHELPIDSLIPDGKPQIVRRPFWERGADNILFVIRYMQQHYADSCNMNKITLIGHSNGGDMSALFPQKYPGYIYKLITLDNRRMALPRSLKPRVYTLRSSDQPADEGVLPDAAEQQKWKMTMIKLPATIHNDMNDGGTTAQQAEINQYLLRFLKE